MNLEEFGLKMIDITHIPVQLSKVAGTETAWSYQCFLLGLVLSQALCGRYAGYHLAKVTQGDILCCLLGDSVSGPCRWEMGLELSFLKVWAVSLKSGVSVHWQMRGSGCISEIAGTPLN